MSFLDRIKDGFSNATTPKKRAPMTANQGIGNGGMVYQDDMIVSKPVIVFHAMQVFFNFLAMCCFASVASFQAKWKVGPSGLSGFAIFISIAGMLLSLFLLLVPVLYEKYDKLSRLARMLKEVRVGFILTILGTTCSALISFIVTISAWTQPGCKDATKDPHAGKEEDGGRGEDFVKNLPGWCNTKKAGAIFFWLAFAGWLASLGWLIYEWRSGKLHAPRDPPFTRPVDDYDHEHDEEDEESTYGRIPPARSNSNPNSYSSSNMMNANSNADSPFADSNRYSGRQSVDAYGAFSDPAPTGFGSSAPGYSTAPRLPDPDFGGGFAASPPPQPQVSRTMQYADPYAAVRASIASAASGGNQQSPTSLPSYETAYQGGYR